MKESPTTVTKKQGWGGKRAGSGRKPGTYAGTSKVTTIVLTAALIEKLHKLGGSSWVREQIIKSKDDLLPAEKPESLASLTSIGSYFNSTEEDPLSACLVRNPEETVFCIAEDDTMKDSGIDFGDLLIVDRSADPQNGSMVVVHTADGYSIRKFLPASEVPQGEPNLFVSPDSNWRLLGVIVYVVKNIQGAVDALAIKEAAAV